MKIAFIGVKGVPASTALGGGIERHVETLAPALARLGHEMTIYVRSYTNPRRRREWEGCALVTLPTIKRKNLETIIHIFLSTIHALFQHYDIIHYHGVGPSTLAWIPRVFKRKTKIVVTFHARDQFHEKWNIFARAYLAWGEWTAVTFPNATISISHVIQTFCKRMFHRRTFFIPNGVTIPTNEIGHDRLEKLGVKPNGFILGLGRLLPIKAYDTAIRAFRDVPTAIEMAIAGAPGYDEHYAEELYALAELDERIHMLGFRDGEDLEQLLAHCYAFIHPSRTEGLSFAVLEAMAHGKVVLMSDIPANLELIDHSGISFRVGDEVHLKEILTWVTSDESMLKERGKRAQTFVHKNYSWKSVVQKHDDLYRSLINTKDSSTM